MFGTNTLSDEELVAYGTALVDKDDDALVAETSTQIYDAGYSRFVCAADQRAGACYREAVRREKSWLYVRGYNRAAQDAGVTLDSTDIDRAKAPAFA